ncbi:unnamed protein product [Phaeothamnion confervicola]
METGDTEAGIRAGGSGGGSTAGEAQDEGGSSGNVPAETTAIGGRSGDNGGFGGSGDGCSGGGSGDGCSGGGSGDGCGDSGGGWSGSAAGLEPPRRTSLWARVVRFYVVHQPDRLEAPLLAEIVTKYRGKEAALDAKLVKKYGIGLLTDADSAEVADACDRFGLVDPDICGRGGGGDDGAGDGGTEGGDAGGGEAAGILVDPGPPDPAARLDFRSPHFDAALALRTPGLRPPVLNVQALDNTSKFVHLLPGAAPPRERRAKPPTGARAAEAGAVSSRSSAVGAAAGVAAATGAGAGLTAAAIAAAVAGVAMDVAAEAPAAATAGAAAGAAAAAAAVPRARNEPFAGNPVTTIASGLRTGPYSLLTKSLEERHRVRVMIRRVNSVRGTCEGLLLAFDKHMNMVLLDVTERYIAWVLPAIAQATAGGGEARPGDRGGSGGDGGGSRRDDGGGHSWSYGGRSWSYGGRSGGGGASAAGGSAAVRSGIKGPAGGGSVAGGGGSSGGESGGGSAAGGAAPVVGSPIGAPGGKLGVTQAELDVHPGLMPVQRQRYLRQLLIRGDNVVLVVRL